jgi:hypothetical protein
MTEALPGLEPGCAGLRDSKVESLDEGGVRCFYSQLEHLPVRDTNALRDDAVQFHRVIQQVLQRAAVVPFRFPTLIESDAKLREFLAANAAGYLEELRRFRELVQMEVRIRSTATGAAPASGTDYMRARQDETRALAAHAAAARDAASELIEHWQVRDEERGLHCYALVRRDQVEAFERCMQSLSPLEDATMVVSGPWPPTQFLHVFHP